MPRIKLFKEEDVLHKAMELFWKKGYHATSIQDLVDYLGINRASLYDTFGGKKELFNRSLKLYRISNADRAIAFLKSHASVKEGIRKLFEIAITDSVNDKDNKGCFTVNTATGLVPGDNEIQAMLEQNKNAFEQVLYELLLSAEKTGEISKGKDLKALARLIFTLYNGIKVVAKIQPNERNLLSSVEAALVLLD